MHLGNVLVTGGLGFIGSHFVRLLLTKKNLGLDSLINLDYMGYGSDARNLADISSCKKYRFIRANINDIESLKLKRDIDTIVNFAAETHVDRSITNPESFVHSNVNGTAKLLEFCRKKDIETFVQISTDEVYGDATCAKSFDENAPLRPTSPYSASKASADLLAKSYFSTYGLRVMISRSCNNFGPNQFPEKLVPKAIILSLKDLPVPIYGDGRQKREWIYVKDNVRAVLKIITKGTAGEIYNISSSTGVTNLEIMKHLSNILYKSKSGAELRLKHVGDRPGHDRRYSIRASKVKNLGWNPSYSLKKSLELTIRWYIDNEEWWKPLASEKVLHTQPWKLKWDTYGKDSSYRR